MRLKRHLFLSKLGINYFFKELGRRRSEVYLVAVILDPRLKLDYFIDRGWEERETKEVDIL